MKTVAVLFLFGFLAEAFYTAPPRMARGCIDLHDRAVKNFRYNEFFTGQWILTHAVKMTYPNMCETFTVDGDKVTFKLQNEPVSCQLKQLQDATFTDFYCTIKTRKKFHVHLLVLATDYNNYALVYRCGSYGDLTKDNFMVLQRQKQTTFPPALEPELGKEGERLRKDRFKNFNC